MITYRNLRIYKYELVEDYQQATRLIGFEGDAIQHDQPRIHLATDGTLTIRAGYLWDGPSGIARDTLSFMRASLVHDALYHLMRDRVLPKTKRRYADGLMRKIALQDGMNPARALTVYLAVRAGGRRSADHDKPSTIRTAPRSRARKERGKPNPHAARRST